jgi:asparagine synthase (glutamine-hydrolysing)
MCGIFCAINLRKPFEWGDFHRFADLTDMIRYRGPDDFGYVALTAQCDAPISQAPFHIFLGNRRLSVIDLSAAGHQPMTDGKGRWITYNGEIFNYLELRKELQAEGQEFRTSTDTEVILKVYDAYGEEGFEKLNGMWAFALVDGPAHKVIVSRDRFSIKPLYRLRNGDQFYFASEIKQLLPLLPSREVNIDVMSAYLWQGLLDHSEETFFRGIEKVAAKTNYVVSLRSGKAEGRRYWNYSTVQMEKGNNALEQFRELFVDSVKIRLRSDVKMGVLLSGGLDSSTIAVVSNDLLGTPLESFSVISENPKYSEERFIDALCQAVRIGSHKLMFREPDVMEASGETLDHNDEPFGGFSVIAQFKMFQMIKEHTDLTVLLSGQGGDEVLLGYRKFFFFYARLLAKEAKFQAISLLLHSLFQGTVMRQFQLSEGRRYIPFLQQRRNGDFRRVASNLLPVWECGNMRARQIEDIDRYSVPALTHYEDRNSMAHSLEVRNPFLDHRLVNFGINLPTEWKIRRGWMKFILREAFPEVPAAVRWRRDKMGFSIPEEIWLRTELREPIQRLFKHSMLAQMGFIEDNGFLKYYENFRSGRGYINPADIARTFIAEIWANKMFANEGHYFN